MKRFFAIGLLTASALALASCDSPADRSSHQAYLRSQERGTYVPKHSLDFNNYDKRIRLSDDPTTIVWCTVFPPTPGVKPITYPVVGKLTSGNKWPTDPDLHVGADGMYGNSGEYRYGFSPSDVMVEISGSMPSVCTTEPTVWQKENTILVIATDPALKAASAAAKASLNSNNQTAAQNILARATQGQ